MRRGTQILATIRHMRENSPISSGEELGECVTSTENTLGARSIMSTEK